MQEKHWEKIANFKVIGISYEKADVAIRGKYAFFTEQIPQLVQKCKSEGIEHLFVLSTCNRTEIYFFSQEIDLMIRLYCELVGGEPQEFQKIIFVKEGKEAVNHLFRVSAGLESQILGDFEVLGQLKTAFTRFKKHGSANAYLERFINSAIQISKQIKNETCLSDGVASVSYAAVQYILQNVDNLSEKNIVLLGTGKIGRNTCENLIKHTRNKHITLVNRTLEKAQNLSDKLKLNAVPYEELPQILQTTDVLIVATGAHEPTITLENYPQGKEMLVIDLSIPENVSEEVIALPESHVVNVDELSKVVRQTMKDREFDIPKAETIIRLKSWEFADWLETRDYVPAIEAFKEKLETFKKLEKKKLSKKTEVSIEQELLTDRLIQKLTNRFATHIMTHPDKAHESVELLTELLHLDPNDV